MHGRGICDDFERAQVGMLDSRAVSSWYRQLW